MKPEKYIRKKLLENTFINLIVFTLILLLFDTIIYNQVTNSLLKNVDEQLNQSKFMADMDNKPPEDKNVESIHEPKKNESNIEINPRIINIIRDKDGNIKENQQLGNLSDFADYIKFDKNNLNIIYNINIKNSYNYRCINVKNSKDENYMQILINVDGEMSTIANITSILILGTIILVLFSIVISYILSKRNIRPIIEMYNKQTEFVQNASHELRTPLTIIQEQKIKTQEKQRESVKKTNLVK